MPLDLPGPRWRRSCQPLLADPLAVLVRAHHRYGDVVALTDGLPVFSRSAGHAGCVAVFGRSNTEQVLRDVDVFGRPATIAERERLPATLANLSSGLFSMGGALHRQRRRMFAPMFSGEDAELLSGAVAEECETVLQGWAPGVTLPLLREMRVLARLALSRVLFGAGADPDGIGALAHDLLALRRAYAATPDGPRRQELMARLLDGGERLDVALRERIANLRDEGLSSRPAPLLARLSQAADETGSRLSEDELVAHGNALSLAASEPVAVSLSWTLLLLSQFSDIRCRLAEQVGPARSDRPPRHGVTAPGLDLLDAVVRESLRLLPPNAVMVRVTSEPVSVAGHLLPSSCEVLVSPYVAHRAPAVYPRPDCFDPARWATLRPSPFDYLPFGGGPRYCLGRHIAMLTLRTALTAVLGRHDLVLARDQSVDWCINVTLMPAHEVKVRVGKAGAPPLDTGGRIDGPLRQLVRLPER